MNEVSITFLAEINSNLHRNQHCAARVFHGRGKAFAGLEHLNVEWYPPYLVIQNFADALNEDLQTTLLQIFSQQIQIQAILHQFRSWPDTITEVLFSRDEGLTLPITHRVALAADIQIEVSLGKNRNTGAFLDMRSGWDWVRAHAKDARVLNLFSYTSVFSLFALRGGARSVDNVDMAANVHKIAERNHQLNGLHSPATTFVKRDVLTSARWFEHRAPYDLIILDPPPYQKGAFHGWPDYARLLQQTQSWLSEHGQLLTCLNHPPTRQEQFLNDLSQLFNNARFETIRPALEIREKESAEGLKTVAVFF